MKTGESGNHTGKRTETLRAQRQAVERVISNVSQKLDEAFTLDEMARMAFLSPFHFNRVFHEITGLPPTQFLYALRIEAAKRLLLTSRMSVTEICFEVGYNSLGSFTSRFKELVGLSPRAFRNLGKQIRAFDWNHLYDEGWKSNDEQKYDAYLEGEISAPPDFNEGLIFVGLFEQMIPQSRPVAGTLLVRPEIFKFSLPELKKNALYLLVAALPRTADPHEYLLPHFSRLYVGVGFKPIIAGQSLAGHNVHVRRLKTTDPPILTALPQLLVSGLQRITGAVNPTESKKNVSSKKEYLVRE